MDAPDNVERDERGRFADGTSAGAATRFAPGNQAARVHGVRSYDARGAAALPSDLRMTVEDFRQGVISDQGGADEMSTIQRAYVTRLGDVEVAIRLLQQDIAQRGLMTAKGRVRGTFSRLLESIDRWDRLAQRIGVERKQKQVSPMDAVRAAVAEANR